METVNEFSVKLEEHWGSDLKVVNAARNSFDKRSEWDVDWVGEWYEDRSFESTPIYSLKEKDAKLIRYLASHKHELPFGHCGATLIISVPFFLWRQLDRHRIGFNGNEAISEVSRRYVSNNPSFYLPDYWRSSTPDKKQGSGGYLPLDKMKYWDHELRLHCAESLILYESMIEEGVCEEQARMVLPVNTMTNIWWTGSLLGWSRLYNLRAAPDAQKEAQEFAEQVGDIMSELYPVSWEVLTYEDT